MTSEIHEPVTDLVDLVLPDQLHLKLVNRLFPFGFPNDHGFFMTDAAVFGLHGASIEDGLSEGTATVGHWIQSEGLC